MNKSEKIHNIWDNKALWNKAPLYGRRTAQIKLQPFDFE